MSWMWTLAFGHHEDRTPTHGYEPTRDAAMAAFAKSWRRTWTFYAAPPERLAATEQRSLARRGNAKPSRRPERRMLISRRSTICSRSCGTDDSTRASY